MKLNSWREIGSDGDVLLTPCVPEGITGYDDDDDDARWHTGRKEFVPTEDVIFWHRIFFF